MMGMTAKANHNHESIKLPDAVTEKFKAAVPAILEHHGYPSGEVTITSAPDLTFPIEAGGETWTATYSPLTGSLGGTPAGTSESSLSTRRFLLRMHLRARLPG